MLACACIQKALPRHLALTTQCSSSWHSGCWLPSSPSSPHLVPCPLFSSLPLPPNVHCRILFPQTGTFILPMTPSVYNSVESRLCFFSVLSTLSSLLCSPQRSFEMIISKSDLLVLTESCNYYNHIQKFIWQYR